MWTSADRAVHVYGTDASHLAEIPVPGTVSNVAFDADRRMLFITGDELWGLRLG